MDVIVGIVSDPAPECADDLEERVIYERGRSVREGVWAALEEAGHTVELVEVTDSILEQLRANEFDIIFNISTGGQGGRHQTFVPSVLDWLGVPYTGSGVLAHAVALDKPRTKRLLQAAGIQTPQFQVFSHADDVELDPRLRFPLFAKPARSGCSRGVDHSSYVLTESELREAVRRIVVKYRQPALVEEFAGGRELTVGVLGNDPPIALPVLEFDFGDATTRGVGFRTFEGKVLGRGSARSVCPAALEGNQASGIKDAALAAYQAIGCCDFARVDIRLDSEGMPQVLEVNSLPGLGPGFGSFAQMASAGGLTYCELINLILEIACRRYGVL